MRVHRAAEHVFVYVRGTTFSGSVVIPLVATNCNIKPGDELRWQGRFAWWSHEKQPPVPIERTGFAMSEQQALQIMHDRPGVRPA